MVAVEGHAVWGYCDVGPPSTTPCPHKEKVAAHNHTTLALDEWRDDFVYEHRYNYYRVPLSSDVQGVQVPIRLH